MIIIYFFSHNSSFLIPISLQPNGVYFLLRLFDITEFIVPNYYFCYITNSQNMKYKKCKDIGIILFRV